MKPNSALRFAGRALLLGAGLAGVSGLAWAQAGAAAPLTPTAGSGRLELLAPTWPESPAPASPLVYSPAVLVSASQDHDREPSSSRAQYTLEPGQLRAQTPQSAEEALATLPGAYLQSRGPLGIQNDLTVDGSTYSQTLLLVDDVPLRDPQTGHNRLDLPVPPCELAGADLLPEHASSRFGSEAFGGTVNLQTRPAGSGDAQLETFGGDFGTYGGQARLPWSLGETRHTLAFNRLHTDGFRTDTGADLLQAGYAAQGQLPDLPWKLRLGYADKNFGANDFYAPYPSWEHTRTEFVSAQTQYDLAPGLALLPQGSFRRHEDYFLLNADRPSLYANTHLANVSTLEVPAQWTLPNGAQMRLGVEGCRENLNSSNLGQRERSVGGAYVFFQSPAWFGLAYDAGLRLDAWDQGQREGSPSVGAAYAVTEHWRLRTSAGQAFRLPDFTELYYQDPGNQGNPNLMPEKAWVYEAGVDGRPGGDWRTQLTVFKRDEYDVIDWTRASAAGPWQAGNISRVRVRGLTAVAGWSRAGWSAQADTAWLALESDLNASLQSKYQFNFPVRRFQLQTGYTAGNVQPWLHVAYLERVQAAGIWLLDATLRWQADSRITLWVKGSNCFNTGYEDLPGVPSPGRWLGAGTDLKLY